jgi:membrane-bound lytic murein transglycosylase D
MNFRTSIFFCFSISVFLGTSLFGAVKTDPPTLPIKDDPFAARLDSLDVLNFFRLTSALNESKVPDLKRIPTDSVPRFSHDEYRERLKRLDQNSPFDMRYHEDVVSYIEMYAVRKRGSVSRMLGMAQLYFPLFEETLARNKMPLELKYLAVIESALIPTARSKAGATGLWQFMYGTGKLMGLEITSYVDERCDPAKATEAACKYLKYLHKLYGDWALALAAYNCGPGNVNKAIRRSGGKSTYWELRPYLPRETSGYVPVFIAANYVFNHIKEHNIQPLPPKYHWYEVDSVLIKKKLTFNQISGFLGIPVEEIKVLNPSYILDIIPESDKGHALYLPKKFLGEFMRNEGHLYNFLTETVEISKPEADSAMAVHGLKPLTHTVLRGEGLQSIAKKYGVSIDSLMAWNSLKEDWIGLGQNLVVYVDKNAADSIKTRTAETSSPATAPTSSGTSGTVKYHTVKSGETLWAIAKKYGVSIDEIKRLNNMRSDTISVGQRLKIKA